MKPNDDRLPDPVAYARGLTDEQLREYKEIFGEESREWIIAQDELARRSGFTRDQVLWNVVAAIIAIAALWYFLS